MFDRRKRKGWMLASSLACPFCHNRVHGDKEYIWCMTYDCMFFCKWEEADTLYSHNVNQLYTEDFTGSIHHIKDNRYMIIKEKKNRLYKRR